MTDDDVEDDHLPRISRRIHCRFSLAPKIEFNFHPGNEHFELIEKD